MEGNWIKVTVSYDQGPPNGVIQFPKWINRNFIIDIVDYNNLTVPLDKREISLGRLGGGADVLLVPETLEYLLGTDKV